MVPVRFTRLSSFVAKGFLVAAGGLLLTGCLQKTQPGALKVQTQPAAKVIIDGKEMGAAPFTDEKLAAGEVTLKLVPEDSSLQSWEGLVDITPGVYTVVIQDLAATKEKAAGEVLTMEPNSQSAASLSVVSDPDAAIVKLDGESKGFTPLDLGQVNAGNHQLVVSSPGYADRTIDIQTQTGYTLAVSVKLSKQDVNGGTPTPGAGEATGSATLSGTPSPKVSGSPTPKVSGTPAPTGKATATPTGAKPSPTKTSANTTTPDKPYVKITTTPTGWLRVRSEASASGEEVARVNPGEMYALKDEKSGWYQIEYEKGKMGWISGQYAQKYE